MAEEPHVIRGINWREAFPFTNIFRAFRIAIHPSKLVLALLALLALYFGGRILDGFWMHPYKAVPGEIEAYETSRTSAEFNERRNAVRSGVGRRRLGRVARRAHADHIRLVRAVDRVDRVVDRGMEDCEVPGWLDVRRLRTRCVHDRQENLVPLDHRPAGLVNATACISAGGEDRRCAEGTECESKCEQPYREAFHGLPPRSLVDAIAGS